MSIIRYDSAGNEVWIKNLGSSEDRAFTVALDDSSNVLVSGRIGSFSLDFGGGPLFIADGTLFLVKFDASGNHLWSRQYAGGSANVRNVLVETTGDVILTGIFSGSAIWAVVSASVVSGRCTMSIGKDWNRNWLRGSHFGWSFHPLLVQLQRTSPAMTASSPSAASLLMRRRHSTWTHMCDTRIRFVLRAGFTLPCGKKVARVLT